MCAHDPGIAASYLAVALLLAVVACDQVDSRLIPRIDGALCVSSEELGVVAGLTSELACAFCRARYQDDRLVANGAFHGESLPFLLLG